MTVCVIGNRIGCGYGCGLGVCAGTRVCAGIRINARIVGIPVVYSRQGYKNDVFSVGICLGSGIGIFFAGICAFFIDISPFVATGFAAVSLVFLGIMFAALGGMLVIAAIAAVKGFINICIAIINHHARIFAGHDVLEKLGGNKKNNGVEKEAAAQ